MSMDPEYDSGEHSMYTGCLVQTRNATGCPGENVTENQNQK